MALSKKDYVALAGFIRTRIEDGRRLQTKGRAVTPLATDEILTGTAKKQTAEALAWDVANYFAAQNPRFDRSRFLKACGIGQEG